MFIIRINNKMKVIMRQDLNYNQKKSLNLKNK